VGQFIAHTHDLDPAGLPANAMVTGYNNTPMRAAILVRQQTKRPLIVLGADGELRGCVGEHEIYRGMLKQLAISREEADAAERAEA
jgi:glycine betaine/proline transport system ATP-binding protein